MRNAVIRRILVADDEEEYRVLVRSFLQRMNLECDIAAGAVEALEKLKAEHFDLVVSDIRMEGTNGLELAREARKRYPDLDFIIMTGHVNEYSYMDILDTGARDFILKPFDPRELEAKITRLERERQAMRSLRETNEALSWEAALNSAIAELSEAFLRPHSLKKMSALALKRLMRLTGSPQGFIVSADVKTGYALGSGLSGHSWERVREVGGKTAFRKFRGSLDWLPKEARPILSNNGRGASRSSEPLINRFISAPAVVNGTLLAHIIMANANRDYTEKDLSAVIRLTSNFSLILQSMQANAETKEIKEYLETVLDNSSAVIGIADSKGRIVKWNKAATEAYGYTLEEMQQIKAFDLYADKESLDGMLTQLRKNGSIKRYEIDMRRKDGSIAPFELSISLLKDPAGNIRGSSCVAMDMSEARRTLAELRAANERLESEISERKRVEDELNESERRFGDILSDINLLAVCLDVRGCIAFCNNYLAKLTGLPQGEILGMDWFESFLPPDTRYRYRQLFNMTLLEGEIPPHYESEILTPRGDRLLFSWSNSVMFDAQGDVIGTISIGQDISERKTAEDELRKAHGEMEHLIASISSILIRVSGDNVIRGWNRAAEKAFGLLGSQVIGRHLGDCGIPWNWEAVSKAIEVCGPKCESKRCDDIRYTRPDGKEGILGIVSNPIKDGSGNITGLLLLGSDITERRILESQLSQAQKLESIGQLAAGIAHEINTPTQYVGDNTRFLQDAFGDISHLLADYYEMLETIKSGAEVDDLIARIERSVEEADLEYLNEEIPKAIDQSLEGIERISKIVKAMKEFSHPGSEEKTAIDINKAIESTITVARNEWKYLADMVTDFDPMLPLVSCLPGELNQVILNMIINASHTIGDVIEDGSQAKGTISIGTKHTKDSVEIRISDTGRGIPENIRSRIFDPFFTTKQVGRGTGQGLAISHSVIVDKHGGNITFETEVGKGTTFIISLPCMAS